MNSTQGQHQHWQHISNERGVCLMMQELQTLQASTRKSCLQGSLIGRI